MNQINKYLLIIVILISGVEIFAEGQKDTRGKDFWITFLPNYHNNNNSFSNQRKYGDSLSLYISATEACSGYIDYYDINGTLKTQVFDIIDPRIIYTFTVEAFQHELLGDLTRIDNTSSDNELVSKKSFHIVTEKDVIVQGLSHAQYSSEGFLALPVSALSQRYYIMSYNNNWFNYKTPSQFAVVATEDNTTIDMRLNAESNNGETNITVTLNKGETYLVQSEVDDTNRFSDFTGSEVLSDKPIAVFSGHQRAGIPYDDTSPLSSDMLVEQMIPIQLFGTRYAVAPFQKGIDEDPNNDDLFRIIAAYDDTEILINGVYIETINEGDFFEGALSGAFYMQTSRPVLLGLFRKSTSSSGSYSSSDPFFMIIPPVEKFVNEIRLESISAYSYFFDNDGNIVREQVFKDHYLNIVYNTLTTSSIILDGSEIINTPSLNIPNSDYKYFIKKVSQGIHEVSSDGDIGMIAYGYGEADSYGFLAGIKNTIFDYKPPVMYGEVICDTLHGTITDSTKHDTRITEVTVPAANSNNVSVEIINFQKFSDVINFSATLINKYQDGNFQIVALDSFEIETKETFDIPGFTVSVPDFEISGLYEFDGYMPMNRTLCTDIIITNYGKFVQTIDQIIIKNRPDLFTLTNNTNITLNPGQSHTVSVCYTPEEKGEFTDTLIVANQCSDREVAELTIQTWTDEVDPEFTSVIDDCNTFVELTITDTTLFDFGLETIDIRERTNLNIFVRESLPAFVEFDLTVIDPYMDAVYEINARDSVGHELTLRDTIQGFTLEITDMETKDSTDRFEEIPIGTLYCQEITLYNYGLKKLVLDRIYLNDHIEFSIPLSQLPVEIEPGDSSVVEICFRALESGIQYNDILSILFNCLDTEIKLEGMAVPIELVDLIGCDIPVRVIANKLPKNAFLEQNIPNPTQGSTSIIFGVPKKGNVSIDLYSIEGQLEKQILNTEFQRGLYEIELQTFDLRPGVYLYVMRTDNRVLSRKLVIDK